MLKRYDPSPAGAWRKRRTVFLLAIAAGAMTFGGAKALELDGRVTSSSFVYETFPPGQEKHWDFIQRVSLDARELGHPSLSLHWLGTHRGEVLEEGIGKSRARAYHAYLRFRPRPNALLALGRQWVYAGVGSGRLDGARLQLTDARLGRLTLFGGTRGFLDPAGDGFEGLATDAFDESGLWGAAYRSAALPAGLGFGVSAARLFRGGEEEGRRLGLLALWRPRDSVALRYEHRYDLGQEVAYHRHLRLDYRFKQGSASLAWNRREGLAPSADQSYIARYFQDRIWFTGNFLQLTDEVRAHMSQPCRLLPGWTINLHLIEVFPEGEKRGDGLSIGLSRPGYAFGYRLQRGFGGDQDGIYGKVRYELTDGVALWLDLNKVYYRYGEVDDLEDELVVDDESLATRLGLDATLADRFDVTTAVELLRNPRAEHQLRFLGRVAYRFRVAPGQEVSDE